jgi:hypothetical protein
LCRTRTDYSLPVSRRTAKDSLRYPPSTRRVCSIRISSAMLIGDSRTSSAKARSAGIDR